MPPICKTNNRRGWTIRLRQISSCRCISDLIYRPTKSFPSRLPPNACSCPWPFLALKPTLQVPRPRLLHTSIPVRPCKVHKLHRSHQPQCQRYPRPQSPKPPTCPKRRPERNRHGKHIVAEQLNIAAK